MYSMGGSRQPFFFQRGPEMPEGWTPCKLCCRKRSLINSIMDSIVISSEFLLVVVTNPIRMSQKWSGLLCKTEAPRSQPCVSRGCTHLLGKAQDSCSHLSVRGEHLPPRVTAKIKEITREKEWPDIQHGVQKVFYHCNPICY